MEMWCFCSYSIPQMFGHIYCINPSPWCLWIPVWRMVGSKGMSNYLKGEK